MGCSLLAAHIPSCLTRKATSKNSLKTTDKGVKKEQEIVESQT